MKRNLLLLCLLVSTTSAFTQFEKGRKILGGNINAYRQKSELGPGSTEDYYTEAFLASISAGKFMRNNLAIGLTANAGKSNSNSINNTKWAGLGLFARKFFPIKGRFFAFGEAGVGYSYSKGRQEGYINQTFTEKTTRQNTIGLSVNPGVSFMISRRFLIELALPSIVNLGYGFDKSSYKAFPQVSTKGTRMYFNSDLNLGSLTSSSIGFRLLF